MKKLLSLLLPIILCFSLVACSGNVKNVAINIGDHEKFTEEEIQSAMDCVKEEFKNWDGCKLIKLCYEENSYANTNSITLYADFYVGFFAESPTLNHNSTYEKSNWILVRDSENDNWRA